MNSIALDFIKQHEGCRLKAYLDSGGLATVGWGATGPDIHPHTVWTQQQADARLAADIAKFEAAVRKVLSTTLSDRQMAALISFTFNLSEASLLNSNLLRLVNERNFMEAAKQFARWDHVGKTEVKGLLIRRFEEAALFLRGS